MSMTLNESRGRLGSCASVFRISYSEGKYGGFCHAGSEKSLCNGHIVASGSGTRVALI